MSAAEPSSVAAGDAPAQRVASDAAPATLDAVRSSARLPLFRKIAYGAGQIVELIVSSMLNSFALFYVTAVCGLPGGLAGLALGAGLVIDAFMDPFIGSLSDGWRSRLGRRVPFMVAGLLPLVVAFNLMFSLPSSLQPPLLFGWLLILSVCLRASLSVFTLPFQALGADLSDDYAERSAIAAWRWGIGILGTLAVIGLGYGVFLKGPEGLSRAGAYLPLTLSLSVLIVAGALLAIRVGAAVRSVKSDEPGPTDAIHRRLFGEMAEMFRNRTFRTLFASKLLLNVAQGLFLTLSLHMHVFFWRLSAGQIQQITLPGVLGLALAAPLAGPLAARIEKRTMLLIGLVGMALCQSTPVLLKLFDLLPLTGAGLIAFLAAATFANAVTFALGAIAFIAIIPDAADEHEQLFGTRRQGLYAAGWAFATKAATGGGLLIAGLVLQLIHFPTQTAAPAAAAAGVPRQTADLLAFIGGPGSAVLALLGIVFVLFYRIDRKGHAAIMADLAARRGG
ncbi:MFS transporter [Caulobacter sp. KR2-114]|uniref:MFS transporter n=1 Tax=Caulobacter sp. KR2-114 TaxID=3400912 RepID=UPI003BFCF6E4